MTNEERLLSELGISNEYSDHSMKAILSYADEIRRECEGDKRRLAEKLRNYLPHCGKQDMTNGDRELVEWVEEIMGKEAGE